MARVLLVVSLLVGCLFTEVYAQPRKTVRSSDDVRISTKHPTVYITFERVGKREPRRSNESDRGVWLRLHNNTRWNISVRAYGVPNLAFTDGKAEEIGLFYDVAEVPLPRSRIREINGSVIDEKGKCETPIVGHGDLFSSIELAPGTSKLFSVPREHLCDNLFILVDFRYSWERKSFDNPQHRVRFYGFDIPREAP